MTGALALSLRVGLSLAVVLGLLWILARILRGRTGGRMTGMLEVLARHQVGRSASVTVVRVGERALVLGVTETQISLLADTTLDATGVAATADAPARVTYPTTGERGRHRRSVIAAGAPPLPAGAAAPDAVQSAGPLTGSVLSPTTWRTTMSVLRERTVRR